MNTTNRIQNVMLAATAGVAILALVWAAIALADEITCDGGNCNGTQFDDTITGSSKKDGIKAKAGNDEVYAKKGNDTAELGDGNDYIEGGKGNDTISGGDGSDEFLIGGLFGDSGDDTIEGGDGNDDVYGGAGEDVLLGGPGEDQLDGELDDDKSKDRLSCGPGSDLAFVDSKDKVGNDCEEVIPAR